METSYTGLTFAWNSIPCELVGGTGFHYRFRLQSGIQRTDSTTVSFRDLDACTQYHVDVWAANNVGLGQAGRASATTRVVGKKFTRHFV